VKEKWDTAWKWANENPWTATRATLGLGVLGVGIYKGVKWIKKKFS
jgi:hypothetical protein